MRESEQQVEYSVKTLPFGKVGSVSWIIVNGPGLLERVVVIEEKPGTCTGMTGKWQEGRTAY